LHKDERSLVQKYKDQPFVILGVSNDSDAGMLRETQQEQNITWRSWWDERRTITRAWRIEGFPTLYVIDSQGIIRKRFKGKPDADVLEKEIQKWLKETRPTS
jgi:cytochrome c biogenesis protein CcmG, thiol:disulfide interchange protein DsbE